VITECKKAGCKRNNWAGGLCRKHFNEANELESALESKCCKLARDAGFLAWKFTSPGKANVPDRIFRGVGRVFFVEFKKRGKGLREGQARVTREMLRHGAEVHKVDRISDFKKLLG